MPLGRRAGVGPIPPIVSIEAVCILSIDSLYICYYRARIARCEPLFRSVILRAAAAACIIIHLTVGIARIANWILYALLYGGIEHLARAPSDYYEIRYEGRERDRRATRKS